MPPVQPDDGTGEEAGRGPAPAISASGAAPASPAAHVLTLSGDWTMGTVADLGGLLDDVRVPAGQTLVLDGSAIGRFDTAGAWAIEKARRAIAGSGAGIRLAGFSPAAATLIGEVSTLAAAPLPVPPHEPFARAALVEIGKGTTEVADDGLAVLAVLGESSAAVGAMLVRRRRMRWAALFTHIHQTSVQAVPIIALMSFLIGMIIAQQGGFYLHTYGADILVVDLVGVLTCREIGVLLTAIMVAGRSGSAFTAEIGSMKMREEIDALKVLGLSPIDVLVVPRLLALVLALPILTLVSDIASIVGAWLVALFYIGIPTDVFVARLHSALTLTHVKVGFIKAPFMAVIVGLVACVEGMKVEGSAESLGRHTTASVVKAIFMVVVTDGVFAIAFAAMGM